MRNGQVAGAQQGNRAAGRTQVADGHIPKTHQGDATGYRAFSAELAGLHQESALVQRITTDVVASGQVDDLSAQWRTPLAVEGHRRRCHRGLGVEKAATGGAQGDGCTHGLRFDPALRKADIALASACGQGDVAGASDQAGGQPRGQTAHDTAACTT